MTSSFEFQASTVHTNPNTKTHRSVFIWIHPGTWFQKSAFSGTGSAGYVGQNVQDFTKKNRLRIDGALVTSQVGVST